MEVYIKSENSLDELAQRLRDVLKLSNENQTSYQKEQKRYGLNVGGDYYLFERPNEVLKLVENAGKMLVEERKDWNYYIFVESDEKDKEQIAELLQQNLNASSIEAEFDDVAV